LTRDCIEKILGRDLISQKMPNKPLLSTGYSTMQLKYRGNTYETAQATQRSEAGKRTLVYRGQTYAYMPKTELTTSAEQLTEDALSFTLLYRGQAYIRQASASQLYPEPQALNWRLQVKAA
jgi:hypothetical protein